MDINNRIIQLQEQVSTLRVEWVNASPSMKDYIEKKANAKKAEIRVLAAVLKRRQIKTAPQEKLI